LLARAPMPTLLADALEPLVPTAVQLLQEAVTLNQPEGLGMLVYLVRVLPLLNREARDLWRKEYDAVALLTLCDYFFNSGHRLRYMDGVLPSDGNDSTSWTEPLDPVLMPAPQRVIALESIFKNRATLAETLVREERLGEGDVSAALQFELSIVQEHLAFKQHASYAQYFGTCQRVGCSRPALLIPPDVDPDPDDAPSEAEYWKCCRDGRAPPPTSSLPSDMSFCSHGCYKAANTEFKRLVKFDIATPVCQTRRGRGPTPARLYQAAIKRNLGIARELRAKPQVQTKHYPTSMANRETILREQTTMLSVDLGLLYAAQHVHELPARLRPDRPMPRTEDWRKHASCYLNAVENVRKVYMKHGRGELARGGTELWLRRLRDQLLNIF
jgi:hypothetical protein